MLLYIHLLYFNTYIQAFQYLKLIFTCMNRVSFLVIFAYISPKTRLLCPKLINSNFYFKNYIFDSHSVLLLHLLFLQFLPKFRFFIIWQIFNVTTLLPISNVIFLILIFIYVPLELFLLNLNKLMIKYIK